MRRLRLETRRNRDDADLFIFGEIRHHDVEHEPVELRFGKRVCALELNGILRREYEKWTLEGIRAACRRHVIFLHRLEQGRLSFWRRAVDLIGEDDLREDRAFQKAQRSVTRFLVEHFGAGDVGRHQVRCELNALEREVEDLRERFDQQRLRETRNADDEAMTTGEQRDERLFNHRILADDDLAQLGEDPFAHAAHAVGKSDVSVHGRAGGSVYGECGHNCFG